MRGGRPVPRPAGSQPPCFACPKRSPAEAPQYELSQKNRLLVAYFHELRACHGQAPLDELTRQRFGWIAQILAAFEREELAAAIVDSLAPT